MKLFGLQEAGFTMKRELIMLTVETTVAHCEHGNRLCSQAKQQAMFTS